MVSQVIRVFWCRLSLLNLMRTIVFIFVMIVFTSALILFWTQAILRGLSNWFFLMLVIFWQIEILLLKWLFLVCFFVWNFSLSKTNVGWFRKFHKRWILVFHLGCSDIHLVDYSIICKRKIIKSFIVSVSS